MAAPVKVTARIAAFVGLLGVLGGFSQVLHGRAWWWQAAAVMLGTQLVLELANRRVSRVAPIAGLAAVLVLVAWVFAPGSTLLGVPTPQTLEVLRQQLSLAIAAVAEEQAPLVPPPSLVAGVAVGFGLLVVVVDKMVRSRRLRLVGPGLVYVAGLAAASLIIGVNPPAVAFVVAAAAWLFLVAATTQVSSPSRAVLATGMTGCALLIGLLSPSVVAADLAPAASTWGRSPVDVFGHGINPMVRLGENLRRGESVEVLRSVTTADDPPYLKVATLVDIEGQTWRPVDDDDGLPEEEPLAELDPSIESSVQEISIFVEDLDSTMLPIPYPAEEVRGLLGSWSWHPIGGTVRSRSATSRAQTYVATYVEREPDAGQMRARPALLPPRVMRRYLALPDDTPASIAEVARDRTAGLVSDYDRVVALQQWMREDFAYSETSPVAEGYDGNGVGVIERFLVEEQSGYCVHFSSALAVMARSLGIPARIAIGYAPGDPAGRTPDGDRVYSTWSDSLHAWTEVYFSGVGWVPFDATPGVGRPTSFAEPRITGSASAGDLPLDGSVNGGAPQPPPTPAGEETLAAAGGGDAGAPSAQDFAWMATAGVLLLAVLPAALRRVRRWWRWRAGRERAEPLWREILDTATDLGLALPAAATIRGQAALLGGRAGPEVFTVRDHLERERYAADPGTPDALEAAKASVREIESSAPLWRRWLARCLPLSLLRRSDKVEAERS